MACASQVTLGFRRSGKPTDNWFAEAFNARSRQECLNQQWLLNLADTLEKIKAMRFEYNRLRPKSALGQKTPREFVKQAEESAQQPTDSGPISAHALICCMGKDQEGQTITDPVVHEMGFP
jgi:putative transposase